MSTKPYEHVQYPAGTPVAILPTIRDIHPDSPIAGKCGVAVRSFYHNPDSQSEMCLAYIESQKSRVPVRCEIAGETKVSFVEQEYVVEITE